MSDEKTTREKLAIAAKRLHVGISQTQLLLCQDRFLTRLARLDEGKKFVWKGGSLVLRRYSHLEIPRFTVDIDLSARGIEIPDVEQVFRKAMAVDLSDGLQFQELTKTEMQRDTPYGGDRYEIKWRLFGRHGSETLKIDVCAGDDVDPTAVGGQNLFLLGDDSEVSLLVYPPEFIFAEKFETMVRFKTGNTRLKDFIDMWTLIQLPLNPNQTWGAVERCFRRRGTVLDEKVWRRILEDRTFADIFEAARLRRYPQMQLPAMGEVFAGVLAFVVGAAS